MPPKEIIPIPDWIESIGREVIDCSYKVHKAMGPGLLERIYEVCLVEEMTSRGIKVQRQVIVPIKYNAKVLDEGLRLDLLVEESVICELKAVDDITPVMRAQLISYLRLTNKRLGYILNFNVDLMKNGIRRIVN